MGYTSLFKLPRVRTLRRLAVALAVVLGIWIVHAPVLRSLARPLVADESVGDANLICLHEREFEVEGKDGFDLAAKWRREDPARSVVLIVPFPSRAVEVGAMPPFEEIAQRQLTDRGVPKGAILVASGNARNDWEKAGVLQAWLRDHPGRQLILVSSRFHSGSLRYVLDTVLDPGDAARIHLLAVADPSCGEGNWWKSRSGVKAFMFGWLDLSYAHLFGAGGDVAPTWSVAEYRTLLKEAFGEAPE